MLPRPVVECVPNFSEGRDLAVVQAIIDSIAAVEGVAVLDQTSDLDHHRSVITFVGSPEVVVEAAVRSVRAATERIDLTRHQGVHPRLGAADVLPFVPVHGISLAECAQLAHRAGKRIWEEIGVPVYFYEAAALRPDRKNLEEVRRGGFEGLNQELPANEARRPDIGADRLHPTSGACVVGARRLLIAWNCTLNTTDVTIARRIARTVRASSGGFPFVKALGLPLASRNQVQVSMNLTDFTLTPLHQVFEAVCIEAEKHGVSVSGSEIIGLVPRSAIEAAGSHFLRCENFHSGIVLENRIDLLLRDKQRQQAVSRLRELAAVSHTNAAEIAAILRLLE